MDRLGEPKLLKVKSKVKVMQSVQCANLPMGMMTVCGFVVTVVRVGTI